MSRISQTPIPPVGPDEPITPALFNQIIRGANNARQVSGSNGVNVTNIAGMVGITGPALPQGNRAVLVQIDVSKTFGPGMYGGKIYHQPAIFQATSNSDGTASTIHGIIDPFPNAMTCVVVDTLSWGAKIVPLPDAFLTLNGVIAGVSSNGLPMVAVQIPRGPIPAKITNVSGTTPGPWNYTAQTYDGVTTFTTVFNAMEGGRGISGSLLVGTPGSLGVNVGSNGTVNGSTCVVQSIGVGAGVMLMPNPVMGGAIGTFGGWIFSLANSAQ